MRPLTSSVSTLLVATLLVGCGDPAATTATTTRPRTASATSLEAPALTNVADLAGQLVRSSTGSRTSTVRISSRSAPEGSGVAGEGSIWLAANGPNVSMRVRVPPNGPMAGNDLTFVILDGTIWAKLPPEARGTQPGRPWIKVAKTGTDAATMSVRPYLTLVENTAAYLGTVTAIGAAGTVLDAKQSRIGSVNVTTFTVQIEVTKAARVAPNPADRDFYRSLAARNVRSTEVELVVDRNNVLHRMSFDGKSPTGTPTTERIQLEFADRGKPVRILAPPPAEVVGTRG